MNDRRRIYIRQDGSVRLASMPEKGHGQVTRDCVANLNNLLPECYEEIRQEVALHLLSGKLAGRRFLRNKITVVSDIKRRLRRSGELPDKFNRLSLNAPIPGQDGGATYLDLLEG